MKGHYLVKHVLKNGASFFLFIWRISSSMRSVCFIKRVGEKMGTVGINRNADCLLKKTSTKYNKYVVHKNYSILMMLQNHALISGFGLVF